MSVKQAADDKAMKEAAAKEGVVEVDYDITAVTVFRFPYLIVLTCLVIGCTFSDIMVDNNVSKDAAIGYYSSLATLGPYNLIMDAFCVLAIALLLNLILNGFKLHDVISLFVMGILFGVRCTQIFPAIRAIAYYQRKGDGAALGRIPAQLRQLRTFNLVQPLLLTLIAVVQLYSYAVFVAGSSLQVGKKKKE